jgi:hypothetical protein
VAFPAYTWQDGVRYTAVNLNETVRDNLNTLRNGGIAMAGQGANDFIIAISATQFGRLTPSEASVLLGTLLDASWIIASESFT